MRVPNLLPVAGMGQPLAGPGRSVYPGVAAAAFLPASCPHPAPAGPRPAPPAACRESRAGMKSAPPDS